MNPRREFALIGLAIAEDCRQDSSNGPAFFIEEGTANFGWVFWVRGEMDIDNPSGF